MPVLKTELTDRGATDERADDAKRMCLLMWLVLAFVSIPAAPVFAQGPPIQGTASVNAVPVPGVATVNATVTAALHIDLSSVTGLGPPPAMLRTPSVLGGYEIAVNFDPARLRLNAVAGGTSPGFTAQPTFTPVSSANTLGRLVIVAQQTAPTTPVGDVIVANLPFTALMTGTVAVSSTPLAVSSAFQGALAGPTVIPSIGTPSFSLGIPSNPNPPNGATNVALPVTLSWSAVAGATRYDVFFGTLASPAFFITTTTNSVAALASPLTTRYWRITAISGGESRTGPVWSFTTLDSTRTAMCMLAP